MEIKSFREIKREDLDGKRVLVRMDFNVPIKGGVVADDFRIVKSLPLLEWLSVRGSKIVAISHLEDVYSKEGGASSLRPVYEYLKDKLPIKFAESIDQAEEMSRELSPGEVLLVENLRFEEGEKNNDVVFSKKLSELGEIYINESFSVSHRNHASIVGVTEYLPSYAGPLFLSEIENLSRALNPEHPFIFILGGAKFETKLPLIEKYLGLADHVVVAGALANDFFKAKGYEIGSSSVYGKIDVSNLLGNPKLLLPIDVGVWTPEGVVIKKPDEVGPGESIQDIGPESLQMLEIYFDKARFILWNGPLGNYEKGFRNYTVQLAEMISKAPGFSVVGGGDTTAVISHLNFEDKFGFVSTGGGAMLEFLEKGTLPGIEALKI